MLFKPDFSVADYNYLKSLRDEADRKYNDALTALDGATLKLPDLPHPPPGPDELQITPLNKTWNIVPGPPYEHLKGWRRRVGQLVWQLVGPMLEQQRDFNATLVDHINRNLQVQRATREAIESTLGAFRAHIENFLVFQTYLILYLQQITLYVDTKDRREDLAQAISGLASGLNAVTDEMLKRWESMVAREQRYEQRVTELIAAHAATGEAAGARLNEFHRDLDQLRTSLGIVQQTAAVLKRETERLIQGIGDRGTAFSPSPSPDPRSPIPKPLQPFGGVLHSHQYVGFEDAFRGSQEDIRHRQESYLDLFAGASDVLDVGCGRGEFLDLLREQGVSARGVDLNHEMVEQCRARGFEVAETDAVGYLSALDDGVLGGLIALQVVEHFEPDYLLRFLELAYQKLKPGSRIVLETINPACWFAFFASYIRDITHAQPLHPDTLQFLMLANGFQPVRIQYSAPYPAAHKLQLIAAAEGLPQFGDLVRTLNTNAEKINQLLFSDMDYAAIGERR